MKPDDFSNINLYDIEVWVNEPSGDAVANYISIESLKNIEEITDFYKNSLAHESYVTFYSTYRTLTVASYHVSRLLIKKVAD